jgi:hypothetical protein
LPPLNSQPIPVKELAVQETFPKNHHGKQVSMDSGVGSTSSISNRNRSSSRNSHRRTSSAISLRRNLSTPIPASNKFKFLSVQDIATEQVVFRKIIIIIIHDHTFGSFYKKKIETFLFLEMTSNFAMSFFLTTKRWYVSALRRPPITFHFSRESL